MTHVPYLPCVAHFGVDKAALVKHSLLLGYQQQEITNVHHGLSFVRLSKWLSSQMELLQALVNSPAAIPSSIVEMELFFPGVFVAQPTALYQLYLLTFPMFNVSGSYFIYVNDILRIMLPAVVVIMSCRLYRDRLWLSHDCNLIFGGFSWLYSYNPHINLAGWNCSVLVYLFPCCTW